MLSRMPRQTEPSINNALGILLQGMMGSAAVRSEHVRAVVGHAGLQPDIIVTEPGRAPVIVEAEIEPARSVEAEARSRLGLEVVDGRRMVEAVIALRYPEAVADSDDLGAALSGARLSYCVLRDDRSESRFPESGWLTGSVADLADLVRLVSVSQRDVDFAAGALQRGIERAAVILDELDGTQSSVTTEIARLLGMVNVPQARRMACAIIANALIFHERIAGMSDNDIRPLSLVCGRGVPNPKGETLATWTDILDINYWPIFAVGRDILNHIPSEAAARMLNSLELTAGEVSSAGVNNAHDLTGRIFQRLIVDRKYLATFYTLPASAALLARLAVSKIEGIDWSDAEAIGKLRIGDFACGTGALLSAVYEQIAARHERAGGDPAALHTTMMEEVLYGCDVMPSAVHITGSTLSGIQPDVGYGSSRIYTLPYGRLQDGSVAIGSLDLLTSDSQMTLANFTDPAMRTGSVGEETASQVTLDIPHEGFDLVIMNPPFTRNTTREGAYAGTITAAFAAFGASDEDQRAMADRMKVLKEGTSYHGNAGIASAFAALAHRKLKPCGVLALVLPLSAASGLSWQGFRKMLEAYYTDLTVLSIAANGRDMSFSSDTGMAECLVVARKRMAGGTPGESCALRIAAQPPPRVCPGQRGSKQHSRPRPHATDRGRAIRRHGPGSRRRRCRRHVNHPAVRGWGELGRRSPARLLACADRPCADRVQAMASRPASGAGPETGAPRRRGQSWNVPPRHHWTSASGSLPKNCAQPNSYLSRPVEPRRQKRDSNGMRTGLTATGSAGYGGESRHCLGYCQPSSPES